MRVNPCVTVILTVLAGCSAAPVDPRVTGTQDGGFVPIPDAGLPQCVGNRDWQIDRSEVAFAPGVQERLRINPAGTLAPVNPTGTPQPDGTRVWDFSNSAGDLTSLTLLSVGGQWFAPSFPTAQYASRLDPRSPELGVYAATDTAVQLLGVAGAAQSDGTLAPYAMPVDILRFPLRQGLTWTVTGTTLDAQFNHTPVASRDQYVVTVDAVGSLRLVSIAFTQVLRLRVEVTQTFPAGPGTRKIQYLWLTECYGEVARITSQAGEVNPDFTMAQEFRRLGL